MLIIKSEIMDEAAVRRSLTRITHEIIERNRGTAELCLIGIRRRGAVLADMLAANIEKFENVKLPTAYIDITMYRDDLGTAANRTVETPAGIRRIGDSIPFDITDKRVILVDDVIYTGRTARAAIEAVFSHGRPSSIQLAVLIDRGHRELPIRPDFVGKNIPTSKEEVVSVRVDEFDGSTGVCICANHKDA